ncbi:hypothetical protein EIN_405110 [Entamoeba invadens IP1]|uniref:Uncharacterized protein n=1 Tax=Entamoeba invadens IP1 TaxID=370355 RepID=A0A0A1U6S1_ENTIV|nr:hypothetical protein EIN_405110 [Entamoeba invadens IP1]ELP90097.1 hypothetical protein EIN_405110 [Entamoeba invadens IP1]|eukprot:XP_004256868.1 hypothetical protein EIN_405110 [Entamoeba invadens IP1]
MSTFFPFLTTDDFNKSHSLVHELLRHGKFHAASAVMKELYKKNDKGWVINLLTNLSTGGVPTTWNATEDIPTIFHMAWLAFLFYKSLKEGCAKEDERLFTMNMQQTEQQIHFGILLVEAICATTDNQEERKKYFESFFVIVSDPTSSHLKQELTQFLSDGLQKNPIHFGLLCQELVKAVNNADLVITNILIVYLHSLNALLETADYDTLYQVLRVMINVDAKYDNTFDSVFSVFLKNSEFSFRGSSKLDFTSILQSLFLSGSHFFYHFLDMYKDECSKFSKTLFTNPDLVDPSASIYNDKSVFWKLYYKSTVYNNEHVLLTPYKTAFEAIESIAQSHTLSEKDLEIIQRHMTILGHYFNRLVPVLILEIAEKFPRNLQLIELLISLAKENNTDDKLNGWNPLTNEKIKALKFHLVLCNKLTEMNVKSIHPMLVLVGKYSLPYIMLHHTGVLEHLDELLKLIQENDVCKSLFSNDYAMLKCIKFVNDLHNTFSNTLGETSNLLRTGFGEVLNTLDEKQQVSFVQLVLYEIFQSQPTVESVRTVLTYNTAVVNEEFSKQMKFLLQRLNTLTTLQLSDNPLQLFLSDSDTLLSLALSKHVPLPFDILDPPASQELVTYSMMNSILQKGLSASEFVDALMAVPNSTKIDRLAMLLEAVHTYPIEDSSFFFEECQKYIDEDTPDQLVKIHDLFKKIYTSGYTFESYTRLLISDDPHYTFENINILKEASKSLTYLFENSSTISIQAEEKELHRLEELLKNAPVYDKTAKFIEYVLNINTHMQQHWDIWKDKATCAMHLIQTVSPQQIVDFLFFEKHQTDAAKEMCELFRIDLFGSIVYSILIEKSRKLDSFTQSLLHEMGRDDLAIVFALFSVDPENFKIPVFEEKILNSLPETLKQFVDMKLTQYRELESAFKGEKEEVFNVNFNLYSIDAFKVLLDPSVGGNEKFHDIMASYYLSKAEFTNAYTHAVQTKSKELVEKIVISQLKQLLKKENTEDNFDEIFTILIRITNPKTRLIQTVKVLEKGKYTQNQCWKLFNKCVCEISPENFPVNLKQLYDKTNLIHQIEVSLEANNIDITVDTVNQLLKKKKYRLAYDCLEFIQPPPKDKEREILQTAICTLLEEDGQDEASEFVSYMSSKRTDMLKIIEDCVQKNRVQNTMSINSVLKKFPGLRVEEFLLSFANETTQNYYKNFDKGAIGGFSQLFNSLKEIYAQAPNIEVGAKICYENCLGVANQIQSQAFSREKSRNIVCLVYQLLQYYEGLIGDEELAPSLKELKVKITHLKQLVRVYFTLMTTTHHTSGISFQTLFTSKEAAKTLHDDLRDKSVFRKNEALIIGDCLGLDNVPVLMMSFYETLQQKQYQQAREVFLQLKEKVDDGLLKEIVENIFEDLGKNTKFGDNFSCQMLVNFISNPKSVPSKPTQKNQPLAAPENIKAPDEQWIKIKQQIIDTKNKTKGRGQKYTWDTEALYYFQFCPCEKHKQWIVNKYVVEGNFEKAFLYALEEPVKLSDDAFFQTLYLPALLDDKQYQIMKNTLSKLKTTHEGDIIKLLDFLEKNELWDIFLDVSLHLEMYEKAYMGASKYFNTIHYTDIPKRKEVLSLIDKIIERCGNVIDRATHTMMVKKYGAQERVMERLDSMKKIDEGLAKVNVFDLKTTTDVATIAEYFFDKRMFQLLHEIINAVLSSPTEDPDAPKTPFGFYLELIDVVKEQELLDFLKQNTSLTDEQKSELVFKAVKTRFRTKPGNLINAIPSDLKQIQINVELERFSDALKVAKKNSPTNVRILHDMLVTSADANAQKILTQCEKILK